MTPKQEQTTNQQPFDLHLHSNCSDGSDTPAQVVRAAAQRGITMLALTDHDNVLGVPEARDASDKVLAEAILAR